MKQEQKKEKVARKPYKKPVENQNISEIWYQ